MDINSRDNVERMKFIKREIQRALQPYRATTEAAVIAGALAALLREAFDAYPEPVRSELLEGMTAFIQRRDLDQEAAESGHLLRRLLLRGRN